MLTVIPAVAEAATEVTVDTVAELQTAVSGATEDITVYLGEDFPATLPSTTALNSGSGFDVVVDGLGKHLYAGASGRHMNLTVSGGGSFTLQNLTFTHAPELAGPKNGGLYLNQNGSADVTLRSVDFLENSSGALVTAGTGTGTLLIDDSAFMSNVYGSAAALEFARRAQGTESIISNSLFDSNLSNGGGGYSGGAMRVEAGAEGNLRINNTAFLNNKFNDAGSQPRGGAIAVHNTNVQLFLNNDYFYRNSNFTATGPSSNADGGAVSVYNPSANTRGSVFVSGSTFEENEAQDDGSAIFIEGQAGSAAASYPAKIFVENSTFINNVSGDAGGLDSGGAIQASGRVEMNLQFNTFVGNTKPNARGGVDIGFHNIGGFGSIGGQVPVATIANNIFTKRNSVDTSVLKCSVNVGCANNASTIPSSGQAAAEAKLLQEVFGTATPKAQTNGTSVNAGLVREGGMNFKVPTVLIAPPLSSATQYSAYEAATGATVLSSDQRSVGFKATPDAGSLEMEYVRYDVQANGGSWSDLESSFPDTGSSYFADATASTGWFEVGAPGATLPLPAAPTPPAGKVFTGWFTAATGGTKVTGPDAAGQAIYAQFADETFTVSFDSNGGSAVAPITGVENGSTVSAPTPPTQSGFSFDGWELDGDLYDFDTPVTASIELVARWSLNPELSIGVTNVTYTYGEIKPFRVMVSENTARAVVDSEAPASIESAAAADALVDAIADGEVALTVGGIDLGTAPVIDGVATFTPSAHLSLDAGSYTISASYTDDSEDPAVALTAEGTLTVVPDTTTTTLNSTLVSHTGTAAEIRVAGTVASTIGTIPVGSVTVSINGAAQPVQLTVDASGNYEGTFTVSVPEGASVAAITANFGGGLNHLASQADGSQIIPGDGAIVTPPIEEVTPPVEEIAPPVDGGTGQVPGDGLAQTGSGPGSVVWLAVLALLAAGGSLLLIRRRKTSI